MKTYIGTKIIQGEPMDEWDFLRDYKNTSTEQLANDESLAPNRPGYKVVYEDGYVSWSPKEPFENAYRELTEGEQKAVVANMRPIVAGGQYPV